MDSWQSDPGPPSAALETPRAFDRRQFLVLVGSAAAYQALRPAEVLARKGTRSAVVLQPWVLPAQAPAPPMDFVRAVIGAGVLAPSHWNTQPWRMETDGAEIRLVADGTRGLPVCDPEQRTMMLALGASLENMVIALRAWGRRPNVTYFPDGGRKTVVATIAWTAAEGARDQLLFGAIPQRRTNRREYDGRGIYMESRAALSAQIPPDLRLHWVDDRDGIRRLAELVKAATEAQVRNESMQREQFEWTRFDDDARRRGDGIAFDDFDYGGPASWFAGRTFNPRSMFERFGIGSTIRKARSAVRSAGALALLCAPAPGPLAWVNAGQAWERFALRATSLGIAHQPLNAPIEVPRFHGDLLRAFGAIGEQPLLLVRLGHAKAPRPSVRRGVAMVASFRNS